VSRLSQDLDEILLVIGILDLQILVTTGRGGDKLDPSLLTSVVVLTSLLHYRTS